MISWLGQMLSIVMTALGVVPAPDAASLGLAIALIAVAVLAIAITLSLRPAGASDAPHPLRAIDVGVLLSQSDPDAAGHPRPRAPGVAAAA
ncbi:DUF6412 domain-containing protein [Streptomyces sp. AC495_CC817]|uniref:DUF6412 domain-containing protein n=1 Tax=Streptomyces sp. AC495_CC817 TaxID=2823900 RepID=UPI001C253DCF|nr:DUF6412 domain-containing protein [Streptomyces sp. AC495_CC817]